MRAEERQGRRFSEIIAQGIADPRLYTLMSMRADFLGELQKDEPLYKVHRKIDVPPLREAELHEVVSRPAELLSARFETAELADIITRRTIEDSVKDVGALPLLSYTLDDMWNGSAWTDGDCSVRVARGGSWIDLPVFLRSANRYRITTVNRYYVLGFRVGRTLAAGAGAITVAPGAH